MIPQINLSKKNLENYGFGEVFPKKTLRHSNKTHCFPLNILKVIYNAFQSIGNFFKEKLLKTKLLDTTKLDIEIRNQQSASVKETSVGDWTDGNSILVTKSAQETTAWKTELIKNAEHSIEISGSICGGAVFREALKAIEQRLEERPHLQVHLLTTTDLLESADKALLKALAKRFPNNFHFIKTQFHFDHFPYRTENHVKLMLVDEKYYIIGGTNYQERTSAEAGADVMPSALSMDSLLGSGFSDMDVVGKGATLSGVMRREFFKLYAMYECKEKLTATLQNHYRPINGCPTEIEKFDLHADVDSDVQVKAVVGGGIENPHNRCINEIANLTSTANKAITVAQMYFDPHKEVKKTMDDAALKKIPITVITNGMHPHCPIANRFYSYANKRYYSSLMKTNSLTKVYNYRHGHNVLHKKVAVFERLKSKPQTVIGSYNWGGKSDRDYEMIITLKSNRVARKVFNILADDCAKSSQVSKEEANISLAAKASGYLQHLLYPILVG